MRVNESKRYAKLDLKIDLIVEHASKKNLQLTLRGWKKTTKK